MMRSILLVALLAALPATVTAQRMVSASPHFSGPAASHHSFAGNGLGRAGRGFPGGFYYPLGLADPLYADYLSNTGYPVASQPPVIVVQPSAPAPAVTAPDPPVQPLMIELQGDRYVQIGGVEKSREQMIDRIPAAPVQATKQPSQIAVQKNALSAVLIFRDGHQEEISDYTIADGAVYARANYYNSGAWNRKIELAALNLPETVQLNQSRGLRFQLPTAPNEVIVGP